MLKTNVVRKEIGQYTNNWFLIKWFKYLTFPLTRTSSVRASRWPITKITISALQRNWKSEEAAWILARDLQRPRRWHHLFSFHWLRLFVTEKSKCDAIEIRRGLISFRTSPIVGRCVIALVLCFLILNTSSFLTSIWNRNILDGISFARAKPFIWPFPLNYKNDINAKDN